MNKIINSIFNKYVVFTIVYWLLIGPLIYDMSKFGFAAFGGWDSITQIYQVMLYISRLIKKFFNALFGGGSFTFPMVEWNLGMGDDVIAALNWHGFGDPFYLLTIFVNEEQLPYFFTFLFYFRVYLGGIAFIALAHELNNRHSNFAYVIGALIYSFTGFTIQCNMHLIFVHAMMYIPLLLLGAERTMENKKKWVLSLTVFLFALSGFYYLYIGSIVLAVYVIYRFIRNSMKQGKWQWKLIFIKIGEMIAEYTVGVGMSAVIFVPAVLGFLTSNRASVKENVPIFMTWSEFKSFWINLFLPQYDNYQVLSICTIGVICILFTMLARKKYVEKINTALLFVSAFIPMISVAMSGFGECYDRWEVVIVLYFAYLAMEMWDELYELSWVQKIGGAVVFLVLGILGRILDILDHERYSVTIIGYGILLFVMIVILPMCKRADKRKIGLVILFVVSVLTIGKDWRCIARDREITNVRERDVVSELVNDTTGEFYRIDNERTWSEPRNGQNIALTLGYHGISEYISIENPSYTNALVKWNVSPDAFLTHMNVGLDTRGILETLCSVKYLLKKEDTISTIPYGFSKVKTTQDAKWSLYENSNALPVVYTYDNVFDKDTYQKMNGFERQMVMLRAASAEDYSGELPILTEVDDSLEELEYSIVGIEGGEIDGDNFCVNAGGTITLDVKLKESGENYLLFDDVDFNNNITVTTSKGISKGLILTPGYHNGNIGVNLGIVDTPENIQVTLAFQNAEIFKMSQVKILFYSYKEYDSYINSLREKSLSDLRIDTNKISCSVGLDRMKMVCIAVPYSKGWTAYIDNEKADTYRVNDMFIGVEVPKGDHTIILKYITPGINAGMIISILTCINIMCYLFRNSIRNRRHKNLNI